MLWWDMSYRGGESDAIIRCEKEMTKRLLAYDNVRVFGFQGEEEVTTNLDNYMDTIHFSPEINKLMLDKIVAGEDELTLQNYEEKLDELSDFTDRVVNEYIVPYEKDGLLNYETEEE
jgi:hypothetical protein